MLFTRQIKLVLPVITLLALSACGQPPIPPLPTPPVAIPSSLGNPLANLPTNLPNTDLNSAMQGLNALGQLGMSMGQNGQMNPSAMSNFMDTMQQLDMQQAAREYQQEQPVDLPEETPDAVKAFAYKNGKLVEANTESTDPIDLRLAYHTLDTIQMVTAYYRDLAKGAHASNWKIKSQSTGSDKGNIELQMKNGTHDDRIVITYDADRGVTTVKIRYYNYAQ